MNPLAIEVKVERSILASRRRVFARLLRMGDFHTFMPNVKESRILETGKNTSLIKWHVEIDQLPIHWLERNTVDIRHYAVHFKAVDGDLKVLEGKWQVGGSGREAHVTVTVRVETGMPFLERLVGEKLKEKVEKCFEEILGHLSDEIRKDFYRVNLAKKRVSGFALIGHAYNYMHLVRYLEVLNPGMRPPSREFLGKLFDMAPAYKSCDVLPIASATGEKAHGHFIICPIIPEMLEVDAEGVFRRVIDAIRVAEDHRAGIVTLGGFTSIAGERFGREITKLVSVPVTTGNTFTAALTVEGVMKGCERMGLDLSNAQLTVVGGSGDIGSACARILAERVRHVTLVARNVERLRVEQGNIERLGKATVSISSDINFSIADADIVIAAASAIHSFMDVNNFKSGSVICDIGYPKNICYIAKGRNDLLIFAGGLCSLPSDFHLETKFDYGLPTKRVLYGCFSEAILLDLEKRYESFSYGKGNITKEKTDEIMAIAHKHGFGLAPFFWGDQLMGDQEFDTIRQRIRR